jgi:hypothetical protein
MAFELLTKRQQEIIRECMVALAEGNYLDDWDFPIRTGITRDELRASISVWPNLDDAKPGSKHTLAINNSLNEVLHGVHIVPKDWARLFTCSETEMSEAYKSWARIMGYTGTGIR